jgi:aryl-alcohol dehydrogenase-like predicted oxidoreductase
MDYRPLGSSGLRVSAISFGASSLGGVFRTVDESEGVAAVHAALDLGITYFDVAPAYGGGRAEEVLGRALRGVPRDTYVLSTKAGKSTDPAHYGRDIFDYSAAGLLGSIEGSLGRLGVEYLDIVHLHDFDYQGQIHADRALGEGVQTLRALKAEGRIGAVGAGIYAMDLWKRVLVETSLDVILTHNHYTLSDIRLLELLPLAQRRGVGVINASPFASGLLTGRPPPAWHPVSPEEFAFFQRAAAFCEEQGTSLPRLALQFASQHPEVPTTMFSSASPESVRRNVQWAQEPYDPALVAGVQRVLEPIMNRQWAY